jgi:hypothetical protein
MNRLAKLASGAALAAGLALTAAVPADAGVSIGINLGGPGYYGGHPRHWCYYHPGACDGYAGPYIEGGYWAGHGYWHGGRWWGHRDHFGHGWRYR